MSPRDQDGELPEVGTWAEKKYDLLRRYLTMFSTGMKDKWPTRVYLDLFAGAGRASMGGSARTVPTSALIALDQKYPFDRYVFCEADPDRMAALQARVARAARTCDVRFVAGDCNDRIDDVIAGLPPVNDRGTLIACFVDPYGLANLRFATLRKLSEGRRIDFLTLVPSHMDATRNEARLTRKSDPVLDEFLGGRDWRDRWSAVSRGPAPPSFGAFVVEEFARSMAGLRFLRFEPADAVMVDANGHPLYHLALFSKSERGADFWKKSKRSASKQPGLFED